MAVSEERTRAQVEAAIARLAGEMASPTGRSGPRTLADLLLAVEDEGRVVDPADLALAVRAGAAALARRRPGRSVEVRVPPYVAVQIGTGIDEGPGAGPSHKRGTPPAVVEMRPATFLALVTGRIAWAEALGAHDVTASGAHTDLADAFPLA
ncbi:MAG: sterol carrier family protein [Propionibacteriaceae bacterium]|jgi:hypothetical protein|nr:sterol carrier family protein [Propionibacteriaceae bacterium]